MPNVEFTERVPYVELHPTNNCIFHCTYCTYKNNQRGTSLSKAQVDQVLGLKPRFILICGGGDPTSYSVAHDGARFHLPELRAHVLRRLKGVKTLIGTHAGFKTAATEITSCLVRASRVGISLNASYDASQPNANRRDRGAFERALTNTVDILLQRSRDRKSTYVSSTFTTENWRDLFTIARELFEELTARGADPPRVKLKFGCTLIADDARPDDPYHASMLSDGDKSAWRAHFHRVSQEWPNFGKFIEDRTTLSAPPKYKRPAKGEKQCGMVKQYVLAAADGNYYPCCVMAARGECSLGAISNTDAAQLTDSRREFYLHGTPTICAEGCRVKNHTLMGQKAWAKRQSKRRNEGGTQ